MTDPRKNIFDAVRSAARPGLFNDEGNVLALDNLLDAFGVVRPEQARKIGPKGIGLIQQFEGCAKKRPDGRFEAYPDPGTGGDPWTIGWGATGKGIGPGTVWTKEQCDERLTSDLVKYADEVSAAIGNAATTQAQFDALVSFHYNTGAIASATLTKKHIAGDYAGAAKEFGRWVNAGGRVMNGLVRRRAAERELYEAGS
ncbi:glycoside hydrolase family protein [Altererythrobacter indicus]|uniref:Lysozyme n=1 Tax=Altericroceibacterium indicum TaxID=374177 RepID=A0A845A6Y6_9SPHN|nr:lysozyme [Altericroceibacterium indicum]MXP24801.1 glycoside hydrolase family protein [Altericroceibacterium indicum]